MLAHDLNRLCRCDTTDREALPQALAPLVASTPVFLSAADARAMQGVVDAVEEAVRSPRFQDAVLARAPVTARCDPGPRGAFLGFDFHLGQDGPRLIEINTNAGGGLLNAHLARAQRVCCDEMVPRLGAEDAFVAMFRAEHARQRDGVLRTVAIVDEAPETQAMFPEFVLFRDLLERAGIAAVIASPHALEVRDGGLYAGDLRVDLVYNRLTDFGLLGTPTIRAAWEQGLAVVTPHPRAHALYANKANLALLTDPARLAELGISDAATRALLEGIPRTEVVTADNAARLWAERRSWFFKPVSGFGSRAAYRGDKITTSRFAEVAAGDYVAQRIVPPSERAVRVDGEDVQLKVDVRAYAYDGAVQLHAARLYQGQTTNLRTRGGGFAPVVVLPS